MPISILLVDDNATFVGIVSRFLQDQQDLVVVGAAGGGADGIAKALALRPDVVVLDLVMPVQSGFYVLPHLREQLPGTAVVVLTLLEGEGYEEAARAAGATGFVGKSRLYTDLAPAIREAALDIAGRKRASVAGPLVLPGSGVPAAPLPKSDMGALT